MIISSFSLMSFVGCEYGLEKTSTEEQEQVDDDEDVNESSD